MRRSSWIGIACLAGTWLLGLTLYRQPIGWAWTLLMAGGIGFLIPAEVRPPRRVSALAGCLALLPAVAVFPWPFQFIPLLLLTGLALLAIPAPRRWPALLGAGFTNAAAILAVQAPCVLFYRYVTARSHDLPDWLGRALCAVARLFGMTTSYDGSGIALFTMRKVHMLGATWELLLDPLTLGFAVGAVAWMVWQRTLRPRPLLALLAGLIVWLPLRAVFLMTLLVHRALLTGYDDPLKLMNQFWNPWVLIALLAVPVCMAWRFVRLEPPAASSAVTDGTDAPSWRALLLTVCGAFAITAALFGDPTGIRKEGRVLIDERHSTWEPTQRPFDTTWYGHDAGYNYACLYDYLSHYYSMDRLTNQITEASLSRCDVLMLKVPTSAYDPTELDALRKFVDRGGGLLLVGEHTDVYYTSAHLNQVARMFGFEYRKDCAFSIDGIFSQLYTPSAVPHPIVQHMPPMDFEVSCTIQPRTWLGRAVILSSGLWNLPADYHASNFYPQVEDRADTRYGAFIQLWVERHGAGRVAAFTDSTVYSNFSIYEPGKLELMMGMLDWLNHRNTRFDPRPWLLLAGLAALLFAARRGAQGQMDRRVALAFVMFGCASAAVGVRAWHQAGMPVPMPNKSPTSVMVDRTVSTAPLSKAGFIAATDHGFGIFEQWILRIGCFPARKSGNDVFSGDLALFLQPDKMIPDAFRESLVRYVRDGGKVLVIDSALNKDSTANSLLYPFGLSMDNETDDKGTLEVPAGWPTPVEATSCKRVKGGELLVSLNGKPVAAVAKLGRGLVVAVGFGARFSDDSMGITTDLQPSEELRRVFDLEYSLLRHILGKR